MTHTKTIPDDVLDVLGHCTFEKHVLKLPRGQRDRDLCQRLDKALRALGGKWQHSLGGYLFERDPRSELPVVVAILRAKRGVVRKMAEMTAK